MSIAASTSRLWLMLAVVLVCSSLWAQDLPPLISSQTFRSGKLARGLAELLTARSAPREQKARIAQGHQVTLKNDQVEIEVFLEPGTLWVPEFFRSAYGVETVYRDPNSRFVFARAPVEHLEALAERHAEIAFIKQPGVPVALGKITKGVELTGALRNYHELGIKGAGVKVAVIDLGFHRLAEAQEKGELPATVLTQDFSGMGLDVGPDGKLESHGTAVAEIIHDMAPEAELHLLKAASAVQLKEAVDYCISNGVRVINHSVGYLNQSFYDGTGPINDVAALARENGILWVNAAGNFARQHYQDVFLDLDRDEWHNFDSVDETIDIRLRKGQTISAFLTWSAWQSLDGDYEIYLLDGKLDPNTPIARSNPRQEGDGQPTKDLSGTAPEDGTYHIAIRRLRGSRSHLLVLFVLGTELREYWTAERSIIDPATSEKVLAVGAIDQDDWVNGPTESFSSQGPTNGGLIKPDLCGPDRTDTLVRPLITIFGSDLLPGFPGTSAAAPHVAGAAALLLSQNANLSVHDLRILLEANAASYGGDKRNTYCGAGRLNLPRDLKQPSVRVTSSVRILQPGPYYVGQAVTAEFVITNQGQGCITLSAVTVGGRGPDGSVIDFPWHREITLCDGESYTYRGTLSLGQLGRHQFFAAYRAVDGEWNTSIPTDGATNTMELSAAPPTMVIYGIDGATGTSRTRLLRIDRRTGAGVVVGETPVRPITDISFTPDGRLYGITDDEFLLINPLTAATVIVGSLGVSGANALVADPSGRLFGANVRGQFFSVNPATGRATVIGTFGGNLGSSGDLAFAPDGVLYGTAPGTPSDLLIRVDPLNGRATVVGAIGFAEVFGLSFDADGTLFAGVNGASGTSRLIRINPSTGLGQVVGTISNANGLFGLALGREPQSWTLFRDDLEGNTSGWLRQRPWAITQERFRSPRNAWSDSPDGNYADDTKAAIFSPVVDLSALTGATLRFWHRYETEHGYDFCQVWISTDFGETYKLLASFSGSTRDWIQSTIDLTRFAGTPWARLAFQIVSDWSITGDGWYIDDIEVVGAR